MIVYFAVDHNIRCHGHGLSTSKIILMLFFVLVLGGCSGPPTQVEQNSSLISSELGNEESTLESLTNSVSTGEVLNNVETDSINDLNELSEAE